MDTDLSQHAEPGGGSRNEKYAAFAVICMVGAGLAWQVWKARLPESPQAVPPPVTQAAPQRPAAVSVPAGDPVTQGENLVKTAPTAENYLNLSLAYHRARRFEDEIRAAKQALKIRADYAEAWNNIAAANADLRRWDESIHAAQQAVRLSPEMQLARNNLAYALEQKAKAASK